jgi:HlyD family secretion protein
VTEEESKSKTWFRRGVKIALVLVVLLVVYLAWPERVIEVRTILVTKGTVEEIVSSLQAGMVKSKRQVQIRATVVGRVEELRIQKGDRVKKNQLLLELENSTLRARLRLARANHSAGESTLRAAVLRRDAAKRALQRTSMLAAKGAVSQQALDRVQAEFDVSQETVATAEANLAQLKAAVDLAAASLEESRIRAPFDGLITEVHVERGESLVMGAPVLEQVDDSGITVEAAVDEADAGRIKVGMPVRVNCDAYPDEPFMGSLMWISQVVDRDLRQNRHLRVEVGLDGASPRLKVGMSADIEILVQKREDVLFVPTNAVMRRGEVQQVYVLTAGRARLRTIQVGLSNWERTEVKKGLRQGESVVVSLEKKGLEDGVLVRRVGQGRSQKVAY